MVQIYSQRFLCVARCFAIKRKERVKIPFLDCFFTIFSTRRQFICFTRLLKKKICREILSTYVISSRVPICIGLCSQRQILTNRSMLQHQVLYPKVHKMFPWRCTPPINMSTFINHYSMHCLTLIQVELPERTNSPQGESHKFLLISLDAPR